MMAVLQKFMLLVFLAMLLVSSCTTNHSGHTRMNPMDVDLDESSKFNVNDKVTGVRFISLRTDKGQELTVDKMMFFDNQIVILDRGSRTLAVFDQFGNELFRHENVDLFDLFKEKIYEYNSSKSEINISTKSGESLNKIKVSLYGLDFAVVRENLFAFSSAGIAKESGEDQDFELIFANSHGVVTKRVMRINSSKRDIRYFNDYRFSRFRDDVYFIPTLSNTVYNISKTPYEADAEFSFGTYTLTDSVFQAFREVEDYNFFNYVENLANVWMNEKYSFYTFSLRGNEGYLLFNRERKVLISSGIGSLAGMNTGLNNAIPICTHGDELVAVLSNEDLTANTHLLKLAKPSSKMTRSLEKILRANPKVVLMLYQLRD